MDNHTNIYLINNYIKITYVQFIPLSIFFCRFEYRLDGTCSEPEFDMFMQCETKCKLSKMTRDLKDLWKCRNYVH